MEATINAFMKGANARSKRARVQKDYAYLIEISDTTNERVDTRRLLYAIRSLDLSSSSHGFDPAAGDPTDN